MARRHNCQLTFRRAMYADAAYVAAIKKLIGPRATRWTIGPTQKEGVLRKAYNRKLLADRRLHTCMVGRR